MNILVLLLEEIIYSTYFKFEKGFDFWTSGKLHSNHDDMATIRGGDYCSMILGVLQISTTTRNLVLRFKRGSKGEGVWL